MTRIEEHWIRHYVSKNSQKSEKLEDRDPFLCDLCQSIKGGFRIKSCCDLIKLFQDIQFLLINQSGGKICHTVNVKMLLNMNMSVIWDLNWTIGRTDLWPVKILFGYLMGLNDKSLNNEILLVTKLHTFLEFTCVLSI